MVFKTTHNWHPNHQIPLPNKTFNEDELWKLKTDKLTPQEYSPSDRIAIEAAEELFFQLENTNGAKCFNDMRVDFCVDSQKKCWFTAAYSLDFMDFLPVEEFPESPHHNKIMSQIQGIAKDEMKKEKLDNPTKSDLEM